MDKQETVRFPNGSEIVIGPSDPRQALHGNEIAKPRQASKRMMYEWAEWHERMEGNKMAYFHKLIQKEVPNNVAYFPIANAPPLTLEARETELVIKQDPGRTGPVIRVLKNDVPAFCDALQEVARSGHAATEGDMQISLRGIVQRGVTLSLGGVATNAGALAHHARTLASRFYAPVPGTPSP